MKVSIIVPVYNVEKYIERCIASLVSQTYKDLEIIFVDDGTEDNAGKICDEYALKDNRIIVYHNENLGVAYSRNFGIDKATGEAVMFVDSDDHIEPETVEKMVAGMKDTNADMVTLNRYYIDAGKSVSVVESIYKGLYEGEKVKELIRKKFSKNPHEIFFTGTWGKLYKASILKEKNIRFANGVALGEDSIFVLNYMFNCNSVFCSDYIGYHYVKYDGSVTSSKNIDVISFWRKFENYLVELKKLLDNYSDVIDLEEEYLYDTVKCLRGTLNKEFQKSGKFNIDVVKTIAESVDITKLKTVSGLNKNEAKMLCDLESKKYSKLAKREKTTYLIKENLKKIYRMIKR